MYNIFINQYTLYGIVILSIVILIAMILGFIAYMYHTKRKYDTIKKFNDQMMDKSNTYSNQIKKYNKIIKDCGIKCDSNLLATITKIVKVFKGT